MKYEPPPDMTGEEIREAREKLGWTQRDLAARAGTSQQTVDRIERGETKHSRALLTIQSTIWNYEAGNETRRPYDRVRPDNRSVHRPLMPRSFVSLVPTEDNTCPVIVWGGDSHSVSHFMEPFPEAVARNGCYAVRVETDRLRPDVEVDDVLFVDPLANVGPGGLVIAFSHERMLVAVFREFGPGRFIVDTSAGQTEELKRRDGWEIHGVIRKYTPPPDS